MESNEQSRNYLRIFIIWVFIINAIGYIPWILSSYGIIPDTMIFFFVVIGGISPFIAALITLKKQFGSKGPDLIFKKFTFKKTSIAIILLALAVPFLIKYLAFLMYTISGGEYNHDALKPVELIPAFLAMLVYNVWEEFGWRGYLLPAFQEKYAPLKATLLLGTIQALWHWPHFVIKDSTMNSNYGNFGYFMIIVLSSSLLYTYIYNASNGSILATSFFHAMENGAGIIFLMNTEIADKVFINLLILNIIFGVGILIITGSRLMPKNTEKPITLRKLAKDFGLSS